MGLVILLIDETGSAEAFPVVPIGSWLGQAPSESEGLITYRSSGVSISPVLRYVIIGVLILKTYEGWRGGVEGPFGLSLSLSLHLSYVSITETIQYMTRDGEGKLRGLSACYFLSLHLSHGCIVRRSSRRGGARGRQACRSLSRG